MTMQRVAMIGDTGGHLGELQKALINLGAEPGTFRLPADLVVIHVGDLVHKGPDSEGVVELVDRIMEAQPEQWVQLIGNHEAYYVHEKLFEWQGEVQEETAATLRRWWAEGKMRVAAAVSRPNGDEVVVTHAGLTHSVWKLVLDAPESAVDAAARLEALRTSDYPWLWMPGTMLTGEVDKFAGPIWAESGSEVYADWIHAEKTMGAQAPFHQVHGHSTPFAWRHYKWYAPEGVQDMVRLNNRRHHSAITIAGKTIIGIDPGHGRLPESMWEPLVVEGQVATPAAQDTVVTSWLAAG